MTNHPPPADEHGTLLRIYANATLAPNGCWVWMGNTGRAGHGRTKFGGRAGRVVWIHRFVYEQLVGEIPEGLVLDHRVCDNPPCFNPYHLLACTHVENSMRGNCPPARNARKTHCDNGHEYTPENTYRSPAMGTRRQCVECRRIYREARRAARVVT